MSADAYWLSILLVFDISASAAPPHALPFGFGGRGPVSFDEGAAPPPPSPSPIVIAPHAITTSIDTTVATDEGHHLARTTTVVRKFERDTGRPVQKTVKETVFDPESERPTKVIETVTSYDPASREPASVTKTLIELDAASGRPRRQVRTVKLPSREMLITSQIDVATQRTTQRTTVTSDYDPEGRQLLSRETRVDYPVD